MAGKADAELRAISSIIEAMEGLDAEARGRVLDYIVQRLNLQLPRGGKGSVPMSSATEGFGPAGGSTPATDIRTLRNERNPSSINQMTALVAYYLAELAPPDERKESIGPEEIVRYFKHARFRLPARPRDALLGAKNAGYLDEAGERGRYKLSSVGYNFASEQPTGGPPSR